MSSPEHNVAQRRDAVVRLRAENAAAARLAHAIRHVADALAEAGQYAEAEQACTEALDLYACSATAAPPLDIANAVRCLAVIREGQGDLIHARRLWTDARERYRALGIEEGVRGTSNRLAAIEAKLRSSKGAAGSPHPNSSC